MVVPFVAQTHWHTLRLGREGWNLHWRSLDLAALREIERPLWVNGPRNTFILTDRGLKPRLSCCVTEELIRGCASTSENCQGTAMLAIRTDLPSTCCCAR